MKFSTFLSEIPSRNLFSFLIAISFVVQLLIITYNHFSGYSILAGYAHFLSKLLLSTTLTFFATLLIVYPDLFVVKLLNRKIPWNRSIARRITIQLAVTFAIALIVSTLITYISHLINNYSNGLAINLLYNAMIFSVCNILMMITLEAWLLYLEGKDTKQKSDQLEQELSQVRFEVLKNQINPHFMFNSLNVLSVLIEKDPKKAQRFIEEFSKIYRYVLETIEQPLVTVKKELEFLRSFMFLQQIRYGEDLRFSVDLPGWILDMFIPPFALQIVAENACKHNRITEHHPLHIKLYEKDEKLILTNTFQPKEAGHNSKMVGQKNLVTRYKMISHQRPQFRVTQGEYKAILPYVNEDTYGHTDH